MNPKIYFPVFLILTSLFVLHSCQKEELPPNTAITSNSGKLEHVDSNKLYKIDEIRQIFSTKEMVDWKEEKDAQLIYSLLVYTGNNVAIGLQPKSSAIDFTRGLFGLDLETIEWQNAYNEVFSVILEEEKVDKNELLIKDLGRIPNVVVTLKKYSTIEKLLAMEEIRYIEPLGDYSFTKIAIEPSRTKVSKAYESIGCGCESPPPYNLDDAIELENTLGVVDNIYPWNYDYHNINEATWDISTGSNVGVAVFDTGISDDQENLGSAFNSGASSGRLVEKYDFLQKQIITSTSTTIYPPGPTIIYSTTDEEVSSFPNPHDNCGHGTRMAALVAAPRAEDGNTIGIAYNCNLYGYRVGHNVIINLDSEKMAVASAFEDVAERDDIQIISMSMGMLPGQSSTLIEDAINYAWGADKLIFCAAGTSLFFTTPVLGVIFPANLTNTFAITGIRNYDNYPNEIPTSSISEFIACSDCHYGSEVDFVVIMERSSNSGRTTLAVTCSGDTPSYSSGSSCSTASFAGMVALVMANNFGLPPDFIISSYIIPASSNGGIDNYHPNFGWGWVDVNAALGL